MEGESGDDITGASSSGGGAAAAPRRWTCEACGCHTNTESDTSCTICGTSQSGGSFLRRASHARAAWVARGLLGGRSGRNNDNPDDALLEEDAELWDTVVREVEIEREAIGRSLEGWTEGMGSSSSSSRQRSLGARTRSSDVFPASLTTSPEELWNAALERDYSPTWSNTTSSGSSRRASCMEIVSPQICTVREGSGEGRAIRAEPPILRDSSQHNRIFGFRVAFDHPTTSPGHSMGGCYLVGLTVPAFLAYNESNALAQSPLFWGIEDGGNKYEGLRHSRRGGRRQSPSYSIELLPSVPRNTHGVMFGARDVVSVVCDLNSRTACFWRNDTYLGPLVQGLPVSGPLYPVVVPFNARVSAAIGSLSQNLLPLLSHFSDEYRLQKEMEEQAVREKLRAERQLLLNADGNLTEDLTRVLRDIWKLYDKEGESCNPLSFQTAARLWYRCGMSLASLDRVWKEKPSLELTDLTTVLQKVLSEDKDVALSSKASLVEKGDRVQLVDGYEKFGDAAGGPLRPGDRGIVVELQGSPNGESRSIRVIFNGRRWWYQPQALLSERSGLVETAGVWFVRRLLRAHGYHPTTFSSLQGISLSEVPPQPDDIVILKKPGSARIQAKNPLESAIGRVVLDQVSMDKDEIVVESIHPEFTSRIVSRKEALARPVTLTTRTLAKDSLEYTTIFRGSVIDNTTESMRIDEAMTEDKADDSVETISSKVQSDLAGVARLDGSSLESIAKECKKNSEALANIFSAGLPDALIKATETAERQMRSLEPREDLPERISAVGSLALYIAEQLFTNNHERQDVGSPGLDGQRHEEDSPPPLALDFRSRHGTHRTNASHSSRRSRTAAAAASAADAEQHGSAGLVASLQQRRGLLLSLMSRSRSAGGANAAGAGESSVMEDTLNPIADDIFFSRLPPPGLYGTGDRAALLMGSTRDVPSRHLFDAASRSNSNSNRISGNRNSNQEQSTPQGMSATETTSSSKTYLETILRSNSTSAKTVVPSNTVFFQHMIRVGIWGNSAAWIKAILEKHVKKSPQKMSSVLKQAYDEEGTPVLKLSVTFGCSADVVGLLLACGAHVSSSDVRMAVETDQSDILALFLRHVSLPSDVDISKCSADVKAVVERARERQDRLDRKMRESAGEFMVNMLKRLVDLGLISRRHRTARLDSCSRSISEILVGNVLLRALQHSQASEKRDDDHPDPNEESMTGRFSVEEKLDSHPVCGLFGSLPESILGEALFGKTDLATNTLLLLEDFLCSKDMVDSSAGLTALFALLTKFPALRTCSELQRFGMLELVSFHQALASNRCAETLTAQMTSTLTEGNETAGAVRPSRSSVAGASPGLVQCPKKHSAVLHITRHSSFRCDLCGNGIERGRYMFGCRECDWDACEDCTDKAESGLVKCAAIREIATDCKRLLSGTGIEKDAAVADPDTGAEYCQVISEIGTKPAWKDVENLAVRLLRYDRKAIRDLALMLRTPGSITIHQFQNLILPALHVACVGRDECKEPGAGHKSKKARVASQGLNEEEVKKTRNPEERTGFCMELVRAMILDIDSTPRKVGSVKTAGSETHSGNESEDGDDISGDSDNEQRQVVNEREIAFFAEASELLRRLQQVLSLYENVNVSTIAGSKKTAASGDLQSLTKPIELHLRPCTFGETSVISPSKLVLHSEPLVSLDDIKRHVVRCCGTIDPSYKDYCRRLASDRAIIFERKEGSDSKWSIAEIVGFDELTGAHSLKYGTQFRQDLDVRTLSEENATDVSSLIMFDNESRQVVLAARVYYVVQRAGSGKKASLPEKEGSSGDKAPEVGRRVQSPEDGSAELKTFTIISSTKVDGKEVLTLVCDEGTIKNVEADVVRSSERALEGEGEEMTAARWMTRGGRRSSSSSDTLNRVFPFLIARRRGENEENDGDSALTLKRSFSALSLADSLRPTDLVPSQIKQPSNEKGKEILFPFELSGRPHTFRFSEEDIESMPIMDVSFSLQEKMPGVEFNHHDTTLISAILKLHVQKGPPSEVSTTQPVELFFSITSTGGMPSSGKQQATCPKIAALSDSIVSPETMEIEASFPVPPEAPNRARKLSSRSVTSEDLDPAVICDGLDGICMQSMEVISVLSEFTGETRILRDRERTGSVFANMSLSKKLKDQLDDALSVVGGALPDWCITAPSFAPRVFSYDSRRALLERAAFGVSRSTFKQQEAKVNVGRLRQRMASLRARAVELVGEAFSGGAADPTALQLQADELYGMEEALATRVRAAFRAVKWKEHALEVAKAVIRRNKLLVDADTIMGRYARDKKVNRRRLEVRFEGESGFDAASGDEAGVTRGFYADVAEALLSSELVANVFCSKSCTPAPSAASLNLKVDGMEIDEAQKEAAKLPLWIPDMDSSGQVVIPSPRADERSGLGVFPRPIPKYHPQIGEILDKFRFMGRLFAAALRDGFMFPLPLSASFLKLVQRGEVDSLDDTAWEDLMDMSDLPRPGFLGGEIYAAEIHVCRALDHLDSSDPPLSRHELQRKYDEVARDQTFARVALGKAYECSFEDYFQDRTFVDPLDPAQDENAHPLCSEGHKTSVTVYNVRKWVSLAKRFFLYDGVILQAMAFREGIEDFFSANYLRLFTAEELQRDICGAGDNVETWDEAAVRKIFKLDGGKDAAEALVAVAAMGGEGGAALSRRFGPSSPTITNLVKALLEASPLQRRQFLSFVTSVPIVTPGRIEVVPIVSPSGDFLPMQDPSCLPRANTCARRLYLPKFDDYETFTSVLWAVVREESKFKGFFEYKGVS